MIILLVLAVGVLSFANGSNDNFKGVATIWGAGRTSYGRAIFFGTLFTFLGSLAAVALSGAIAAKFNGSGLIAPNLSTEPAFLLAVILASAGTVLLASLLGLPISTTHALVGALVGAGVTAAGFSHVRYAALGGGVLLPLLFSPIAALLLTLAVYPLARKLASGPDCVCVDEPALAVAADAAGLATLSAAATLASPTLRLAPAEECDTGAEMAKWSISDTLHWFSGAAISFARGVNDTPKIVAVLLVVLAGAAFRNYFYVGAAIALGGLLGAARVARTMSKKITPMATTEAVSANLVSAGLVLLASKWALPVSTTHVTNGGIFGIGFLRRDKADWRKVREIVLSWVVTLPMGAVLAAAFYRLLMR